MSTRPTLLYRQLLCAHRRIPVTAASSAFATALRSRVCDNFREVPRSAPAALKRGETELNALRLLISDHAESKYAAAPR